MERDFYQVLGVSRAASHAEIRAAYIRLARRHHPDCTGHVASLPGRLQEIQQAYRSLSSVEGRARHDDLLNGEERRHFARQRAIQRRLQRYDHFHPHSLPRRRANRAKWQSLVLTGVVLAIAARLSFTFVS